MGQQSSVVTDIVGLMPLLRTYARVLTRDPAQADDLVQETLTKAIAKVDSFQPGTKLRAWLFTIMRNTFLTEVHKRRREQPGASGCVSDLAISQPTQESHLMAMQMMQAIGRLPIHYREMLILVVVLGESYEGAAQICGCAVGTVKSRVNRARNMVIEILNHRSGPAAGAAAQMRPRRALRRP